MRMKSTYRDTVRQIAVDNYGYVTTKDATDAGIPAVELPKLAARGGLQNVAYGVYRVTDAPVTDLDQFAEALLRVGDGAYLHGESVLAVFGLADVNPRQIKVAVARRARPKLPTFIEVKQVKTDSPTTRYYGLSSQTVAAAILECFGTVETARLREAAVEARQEGLLNTTEWHELEKELQL